MEFLLPILAVGLLIGLFWMIAPAIAGNGEADYKLIDVPPLHKYDGSKSKLLYMPEGHADVEQLKQMMHSLSPDTIFVPFKNETALVEYWKCM